jgi:hypothetical protein
MLSLFYYLFTIKTYVKNNKGFFGSLEWVGTSYAQSNGNIISIDVFMYYVFSWNESFTQIDGYPQYMKQASVSS